MRKKIAVIGGGASGLYLSALLNDCDVEITLFEKNSKLGKKILASGNGKCNFTNVGPLENKYNDKFANLIIGKYSVKKTLAEFSKFGLVYKNDCEGRCYPVSECATSVLDCLKINLNHVNIKLDTAVSSICTKGRNNFVVFEDREERFDYIVCCTGSSASNLGSEKAYEYLKPLNLKIEKCQPSLCPIIVKENVKDLSGVRLKCVVNLMDCFDECIYSERGEVIFKNDGISGIAVMNASSYINRKNGKYKICLDISNGMDIAKIKTYLKNKKADNLFKGFLNDKLATYIGTICKINKGSILSDKKIDDVVDNIKNLEFNVLRFYSLKDSQVCSGGVSVEEVDENLRLKKNDCIYFAGELLDIDGVCGGYNLQFAWSSAAVIADDIKRRIRCDE